MGVRSQKFSTRASMVNDLESQLSALILVFCALASSQCNIRKLLIFGKILVE